MKMKMPPPRGFDQQERNTLCIRCGAPMFNDICSRCGTRRPTKGPVDLIKKGGVASGGGDFGGLVPIAAGHAVDTNVANTSITIAGVTRPAGNILFISAIAGFVGTPGSNGANATFAGGAMTFLAYTQRASGGNTYRAYQGDIDDSSQKTGDIVVTWTGTTIPDCKAVQYWIVPGSALDFLIVPFNPVISTASPFSFANTGPPPTSPPSSIVFTQLGPGALVNYNTTWASSLTPGAGVETGGAAPVAITWAAGVCKSQTWTLTGSGFTGSFYWVLGYGPLP